MLARHPPPWEMGICVWAWGILDSDHTPVGYEMEFKGGNSPRYCVNRGQWGLFFHSISSKSEFYCVCACVMFYKTGESQHSELWDMCVRGVRFRSVGSALCTAEITSSGPFKPLLSAGALANCPAVRWHAACQRRSRCIMGNGAYMWLITFHGSQCHLGLLHCDIYSACG